MDLKTLREQFAPHRQRQNVPEEPIQDDPPPEVDIEKAATSLSKLLKSYGVTAKAAANSMSALGKAFTASAVAVQGFNAAMNEMARLSQESREGHPNGLEALHGIEAKNLEENSDLIRRALLGEAKATHGWPKDTMAIVTEKRKQYVDVALLSPGNTVLGAVEAAASVKTSREDSTQLEIDLPQYEDGRKRKAERKGRK